MSACRVACCLLLLRTMEDHEACDIGINLLEKVFVVHAHILLGCVSWDEAHVQHTRHAFSASLYLESLLYNI